MNGKHKKLLPGVENQYMHEDTCIKIHNSLLFFLAYPMKTIIYNYIYLKKKNKSYTCMILYIIENF